MVPKLIAQAAPSLFSTLCLRCQHQHQPPILAQTPSFIAQQATFTRNPRWAGPSLFCTDVKPGTCNDFTKFALQRFGIGSAIRTPYQAGLVLDFGLMTPAPSSKSAAVLGTLSTLLLSPAELKPEPILAPPLPGQPALAESSPYVAFYTPSVVRCCVLPW